MNNLKNIVKYSFSFILVAVLSTFATKVASAKTITQSTNYIDANTMAYFKNLYEREDYKNYLVSTEYVTSGSYNNITYYYVCLTNDKIDTSNTLNVSSNCNKMYRFYRSNSIYYLEKVNDNKLVVNNSIYYAENGKNYILEKLLISVNVGLFAFYLSYVLLKIFRS